MATRTIQRSGKHEQSEVHRRHIGGACRRDRPWRSRHRRSRDGIEDVGAEQCGISTRDADNTHCGSSRLGCQLDGNADLHVGATIARPSRHRPTTSDDQGGDEYIVTARFVSADREVFERFAARFGIDQPQRKLGLP